MQELQYNIAFFLMIGIFAISCSKDIESYENDPRIYFFERNTDGNQTPITAKSFSFLVVPEGVLIDTFYIKVKIMGLPAKNDRVIMGKRIDLGSTATEGVHYKFIPGVLQADSIIGYLPVELHRTADIKSKTVKLNLTIAETVDFKPGVGTDLDFSIEWTDNVIKPSNWDGFISLKTFFGEYSEVKWRFIMAQTGYLEFPLQQSGRVEPAPGEFTSAAMFDLNAFLKEALKAYNAANGELKDEFKQAVTFP